ncbi:PIG-L deacetylase family protein [Caldalkalibacillus thermarum]|uniref:PIG-L deacetylase family protein n=1 Tax=Caldalkalibacillus thermarum TaxID=296745 RepID=UPI001FD456B4|nr:PIG-L family deacetylase [Caldalkalibacillus thermarum]
MNIQYIFPHPDDESFGPAAVMHQQIKAGHRVYLLTLTKGGATKQRHKLGLSIEEMGEIRYKEMLAVKRTLGLHGMTVLDFPDSGLKELDPRILEKAVRTHIEAIQPQVIVTYPVHGISGFHDHLVTHAVVKRVFVELKDQGAHYLRRLAMLTLPDNGQPVFQDGGFRLKHTEHDLIDCIVPLSQEDMDMLVKCLSCYETYQETIKESGVIEKVGDRLYFELYGEDFDPVLTDLTARLPDV